MSEEGRIDFGPLDPSRDRERWEVMVGAVVAGGLARRRLTVGAQLRPWGVPSLAMAAALALVVWLAGWWRGDPVATVEPTRVVTEWAMQDEIPATERILEVLGGDHAR